MAITTTASMKGNRGRLCDDCKEHKPVVSRTGSRWLCSDCNPAGSSLIEVVPDPPKERPTR